MVLACFLPRRAAVRALSSTLWMNLTPPLTTVAASMPKVSACSCWRQDQLVRPLRPLRPLRPFSTDKKGSSEKQEGGSSKEEEGELFLREEDELPRPPSYVRDATTGKWTGERLAELSPAERKLLKLDDEGRSEELLKRVEKRWQDAIEDVEQDDGLGRLSSEHERVARRIQEQQAALGPIGRSPSSIPDDGDIDSPLTRREFQAVRSYAQRQHSLPPKDFSRIADSEDPDLLPHENSISSGGEGSVPPHRFFDADLDLAHLNPDNNRKAFGSDSGEDAEEDPFADLMPSDLNPTRVVNRRNAKPIPQRLLHHNNLLLLRRYITPGGKIMNRVQSRLGAKDQRKVSKLIKRARHLGLIPHMGQWKFEDHGNLHEEGLGTQEGKRDWEIELEKRGLWPMENEREMFKRVMDVDAIYKHFADGNEEELDELLGGNTKKTKRTTELKTES